MTPYDIQNKKFEKGMGGYNREDVHAFLIEVADHVEALEAEKADLLRKMEVLADKVEEYREDEESLRAALIGAQKLGDSVVRDSKKKAEALLEEAKRKADDILSDTRKNLDRETIALSQMQAEVAKFKTTILSMYKHHIEIIKTIPYDESSVRTVMTLQQESASREEPVLEVVELEEEIKVASGPAGEAIQYEEVAEEARKKTTRYGSDLKNFFGEDNPVQRKD